MPVVSCNKTGKFATSLPLSLCLKHKADFIGHSSIVDSIGQVVCAISKKPGIICADLELGNGDYVPDNATINGKWCLPYSPYARFITEYTKRIGKLRYNFSRKRKKAALSDF